MVVGNRCPQCKKKINLRPEKKFLCKCGHIIKLENYVPLVPITVRNCIYHIYACRDNDIWVENIDKLISYIDAFNGKKICAIACDDKTHNFKSVEAIMRRFDFKCYEFPNDPVLRETLTFPTLLTAVASVNDNEAVFYGHTKGNTTIANVDGARVWKDKNYEHLLGRWQECTELLKKYIAVGATQMAWEDSNPHRHPSGLVHGHWMFAGTFFWFRSSCIFKKNWRNIPNDRYGTEAWLGDLIPIESTYSIYQPWKLEDSRTVDPYDPRTYENVSV